MDILRHICFTEKLKEVIDACKVLENNELKSLDLARYDYLLNYECYN